MTYIYGLKDPNTNEIRYIGKSDNPKARFQNHMALSKADVNRHKKHWISGLLAQGQKPLLVTLEKVSDKQWEDRERWWIQHGRASGWPLTNLADGGMNNYESSDDSIEIVEVLSMFVDEEQRRQIRDMGFDELKAIAMEAARASVDLMRGYFKGATDGAEAYRVSRSVIQSRLGL
jgi:hypothetical protein